MLDAKPDVAFAFAEDGAYHHGPGRARGGWQGRFQFGCCGGILGVFVFVLSVSGWSSRREVLRRFLMGVAVVVVKEEDAVAG
ncbi:hypothetical protein V6N13_059944 [Hibiscus sabdariffa]|uniref:Uncharacterized protein n=1 Tax=Hibiscus sabdariffa TaxID=183260 RepID=A0ABR2GBF6_9ROSI